jgi:hypothetical protein
MPTIDKYKDLLHKSKIATITEWTKNLEQLNAFMEYHPTDKNRMFIRNKKTGKLIADLIKVVK